jgi:predicted glycosyltransferase
MHDAEAFAALVFGESATMASEAAVLGVPSIYIDTVGRYYTRELESKYSLCYNFTESEQDQLRAIDKGVEILSGKTHVDYKAARAQLLKDKIDVTAFFVDFIEKTDW